MLSLIGAGCNSFGWVQAGGLGAASGLPSSGKAARTPTSTRCGATMLCEISKVEKLETASPPGQLRRCDSAHRSRVRKVLIARTRKGGPVTSNARTCDADLDVGLPG
jgi:hypothetical protein